MVPGLTRRPDLRVFGSAAEAVPQRCQRRPARRQRTRMYQIRDPDCAWLYVLALLGGSESAGAGTLNPSENDLLGAGPHV